MLRFVISRVSRHFRKTRKKGRPAAAGARETARLPERVMQASNDECYTFAKIALPVPFERFSISLSLAATGQG
jgi:hypothetical protein